MEVLLLRKVVATIASPGEGSSWSLVSVASPTVPYIALQFVSVSLVVSHLLPACVLERIFPGLFLS